MRRLTWLWMRKTEVAVVLFGILLRMSMRWNYEAVWSYDAEPHWEVVKWIATHGRVPHPEDTFEAFHPPLYYALAAWLTNHGVHRADMAWPSIIAGSLELLVVWAGLELYVVHSRLARIAALALAAAISASVHLSGMVYPESLNCLWCGLAMLLVPLAFRREGGARWPLTLLIGLVLGLGMLTKISTTAIIFAVGLGAAIELFGSRRPLRTRILNALPWTGTLIVCLTVCGWYFARNVREYGKPFVTSFELPSQKWLVKDSNKLEYLDRRTLGFFFDWDRSTFVHPFGSMSYGGHPRFFPVAIQSTFVDFWGYGFQGYDHPFATSSKERRQRPQLDTSRAGVQAVEGGTVIFVATVAAWAVVLRRLWGYRDFGRLTLVLVPLVTLAAMLHFATNFPVDGYGVVKGVYMTFGAPPLYALFGVAVAWASRTVDRLPVFGVLLASLWFAAAYTINCRLGMPLPFQ